MRFVRRIAILASGTGVLALVYSCSSKGTTNPPPPPTYTISKVSGDSQVGSANAALGAGLTVLVVNQNSSPAAGQTVTWTAASGGGSVTSGTSQTDVNGHATMGRTLGPAAGYQSTTASLSGATGSPIVFTSIAQVNGAFSVSAGTGDGQSDTVLGTLANPFQALVKDYTGAPVAGVIVTFTVTGVGGTLSQNVDTSDAGGIVTTILTLPSSAGAAGTQAGATGLVGSPVAFSATATAGDAALMAKSAGDSQTAVIGTALSNPHAVVIKDAHGNVKSGVKIRWRVGTGGGSVSDTAPTSGATGIASTVRTLGDSIGTQTDTASAALSGSPIVFVSIGDTVPHTGAVTVGPGISFAPSSVTIGSGGSVTWTWAANSLSHSVQWLTASGTKPSDSAIMTSGTYRVTFTTPGTYTYDCAVHGAAMSGTIIVR